MQADIWLTTHHAVHETVPIYVDESTCMLCSILFISYWQLCEIAHGSEYNHLQNCNGFVRM